MNNFNKILFLNMMSLGTLLAISAYSWFSMWLGLEINMLSFIPLMTSKKNSLSSESSMKYFIVQTMASLLLIFSIIMLLSTKEFIPLMNSKFLMIMNTSFLIKLGMAPFHFWFPEVMEGLEWMNCLILLTVQKISPFILLMNNKFNYNFIMFIILSSLIISVILGFNQTSLRKILTYSSINHMAWMITSLLVSFKMWLIYFLIYSFTSIFMIILLNETHSYYIKQLINVMSSNLKLKFIMTLNFLSLGGLPPFIGFLPKWLLINYLTMNKFFLLSFLLIIFNLIMLFIYIRIILSSMVISCTQIKILSNKLLYKNFYFMNMLFLNSLYFSIISFSLF